MVAIVDYGVGNLFSLLCSLHKIGAEAAVTSDKEEILRADRVILPGVGAFADASAKLRGSGLDKTVIQAAQNGTPLLGICLGMQLLFDYSEEDGRHAGLSLLPGGVVPLAGKVGSLHIPHIGWNALKLYGNDPLYKSTKDGECVYFVHSYYAQTDKQYIPATAEYGIDVTASVRRGNVIGTQFHPEKSGSVGLTILRSFID